jgi:hypothetical protein
MEDEDETVEGLDIGATLQRLLAGQVALQRKVAAQDTTIAAQQEKIELLVRLVDAHERRLDLDKATALQRGPVN